MNKTVFASIAALALTAGAFADSTVWYGGDFDQVNGIASEDNGTYDGWRVYDDFTWNSTSTLSSVFGTFVVQGAAPTSGVVEIRDGMSAGNGGTLVYSNTLALTATSIGSAFGSDDLETITANLGSVALTNGHTYWLAIAPNAGGDPNNGIFVGTTSGANSVGSPVNNGNAFVLAPSLSFNFVSADATYGSDFHDFSYGVTANAVPEPASLAVIGLGLVGVIRRRRQNKPTA